jgi:membrane protease YdiL (CAAX protease family)
MDEAVVKAKWGPITAVFGSLLLFFGGQLVVAVTAIAILTLMSWDTAQIEAWFSGGNIPQFILGVSVAVVTLGTLFWYLSYLKAHPRDIGLVKPKIGDLGHVLIGAGIYVVSYLFLVTIISQAVPGLDTEQTQDLGFNTDTVGDQLFLIFLSLVVLPPIVEEVVVRGFLFTGLRTKLKFLSAAILSSSLFGLAHLLGGENGTAIWIATIDTFILGMVLAYLREKTGSLWPPIGLHALKNFVAFMALFVFKV